MKNADDWKPSKFVFRNEQLVGSRDPKSLRVSSRLQADIVARYYQRYLKEHVRGKLVDLGCGQVPFYQAYKDFAASVTCADWENSMHKNPHLDVHVNLNETLPFADDEFDTVILSDVMEHLSRPENLWREMHRILSKEGKVILNVPFLYKIHETPHDFFRYTEFMLRQYASDSGFTVLLLEPTAGAPEVLADINAKVLANTPLVGRLLAELIQSGTKLFLKTGVGSKLSRVTRAHYPLGYFMVVQK